MTTTATMGGADVVAGNSVRTPVTWCFADDGVALVEMHDESGRNALDAAFLHALTTAIDGAVADESARVIVLTGTPEVFSSGASKAVLSELVTGDVIPEDIRLPRFLLSVPLPMIAAMDGHAVGGGLAVGLCADVVIAARESRYGCSFMDLGLTPGMGTTRLLEHCMTPSLAHELLFSGELRRGSEFASRAFNYVLPRAEVRPTALAIAARIAEKSRVALETLKRGLAERRILAFDESYLSETAMHRTVLAQSDIRRLIEEEYAS